MLGAATAIRFVSVSGDAVSNISFLSQRTANTATTDTNLGPPTLLAGDLGVLFDYTEASGVPEVVPTGWTKVGTTTTTGMRLTVSYKIFTSADTVEETNNFTGQATPCHKILFQFRPNETINNISVYDFEGLSTSGNPTDLTLSTSATGGTWMGFAGFASTAQLQVNRTFGVSPSTGWNFSGAASPDLFAYYKIEGGDPTTSYTVFMDDGVGDEGSNSVVSFFLRIT